VAGWVSSGVGSVGTPTLDRDLLDFRQERPAIAGAVPWRMVPALVQRVAAGARAAAKPKGVGKDVFHDLTDGRGKDADAFRGRLQPGLRERLAKKHASLETRYTSARYTRMALRYADEEADNAHDATHLHHTEP